MKHQLKFDEKGERISEVMGWSNDLYAKVCSDMLKYLVFANEEYDSFTSALKGFIESEYFDKTKAPLKTPNDYFMLGYCFKSAIRMMHEKTDDLMGKTTDGIMRALKKAIL